MKWFNNIFSYKKEIKTKVVKDRMPIQWKWFDVDPYKPPLRDYDKSTKQYEILEVTYYFYNDTRKLWRRPHRHHYKYYNTLRGAQDAIKDIRKYGGRHSYMWEERLFLTVNRYEIIKREINI